ncbi:hypothetical protein IE81DRAFT_151707 [Ceraceosorus guamensis]|uniref:Uncharacterized protein n=1 Tax=Ceraceosorus guamensis TaxID=1522189 RepID=A0A316VW77_9BASI|nr:hypothetical protein IE81DRAFT_151707 [Ceraceosorus guamensis]PWN41866.1 hypothetical protein IE81DRAFT_151707 [Ceraceosorus guamensis]
MTHLLPQVAADVDGKSWSAEKKWLLEPRSRGKASPLATLLEFVATQCTSWQSLSPLMCSQLRIDMSPSRGSCTLHQHAIRNDGNRCRAGCFASLPHRLPLKWTVNVLEVRAARRHRYRDCCLLLSVNRGDCDRVSRCLRGCCGSQAAVCMRGRRCMGSERGLIQSQRLVMVETDKAVGSSDHSATCFSHAG